MLGWGRIAAGEADLKWSKRAILALPFAVAASLTFLVSSADRLHLRIEHVAGYGFLFGAPWAWLLDRDWYFGAHPVKCVDTVVSYAVSL